jgi:signal transduction histidine kinase
VGEAGKVAYASPPAARSLGPIEGVDLEAPADTGDPRGPLSVLVEFWQASRTSAEGAGPALLRAKVDGSSRYLWAQIVPLSEGPRSGALVLVLDLTHHVTGSEPVRRLVAQLAHDLRSPLTSIAGAAELLLSGRVGTLAGVQEKLVKIVDDGAGRMADIISRASQEGREGGAAT